MSAKPIFENHIRKHGHSFIVTIPKALVTSGVLDQDTEYRFTVEEVEQDAEDS